MANITVIVPVYKVEAYLHRCVDSILAQSYKDFELILVDDGSPDRCGDICDNYAEKDPRIYVIHQENGGLSTARNTGIDWAFANSNSRWLTFIDSDDWIHPDYLSILVHGAMSHNCAISRCNYESVSTYSPPYSIDPSSICVSVLDSYDGYHVSACMKLFRKDCWKDYRFPVGKLHEDAFTIYKIFYNISRVAVIDAPLYFYYENTESITRQTWSPKRLDEITAYEEQLSFFEKNHAPRHYRKAAIQLLWSCIFQIQILQQLKFTFKKSYNIWFLRKKMRSLIREKHKSLGIFPLPHP